MSRRGFLRESVTLATIAVAVCGGCTSTRPLRLHVNDLGDRNKVVVIGSLGMPVCHYMTVRATVVEGPVYSPKAMGFLLEVSHIDGQAVTIPRRIPFKDLTYEVPDNIFALFELRRGHPSGSISGADAEALTKEYVGTVFDLYVYETLSFGTPPVEDGSTRGVNMHQGAAYGTFPRLVVCEVLGQTPKTVP